MTVHRAPFSFEQAITKIAGFLGWAEAASAIGISASRLRDFSNPNVEGDIKLEDALALDRAYERAGGPEGRPIHQCYTFRLDTEAAVPGHDAEAFRRLTAEAAEKSGEAIAALVACSRPNPSAAEVAIARRDTEQAMGVFQNTLPMLDGAGPSTARVQPRGGAPLS